MRSIFWMLSGDMPPNGCERAIYYGEEEHMRVVLQRVQRACVSVEGEIIGEIGRGFLILLGVADTDTETAADRMADKICKLRIFEDSEGKTNLSLADVGGELLLVSQFTLYADCSHGNRPGFTNAGDPALAKELYEYIIESCKKQVPKVQQGSFGADMKVELVNDGPFTIILK